MTQTISNTPAAVSNQKPPHGPRGQILLGNTRDVQYNALKFYLRLARDYGPVVRIRLLSTYNYVVSHPDGIRHVLQKNHLNYDRKMFLYKVLHPFMGNGLPFSDGTLWLRQRRLMQPAFHRQRIAGFATQMTEAAASILQRWETREKQDEPLNVHEEMIRLTLRIAGVTLFGIDLSDRRSAIGQAFETVVQLMADYVFLPFPPLKVPTARNRRVNAALETLNTFVHDLIRERREQNADTGDLLSMLLMAHDEDGQGMDDQQVRDEIVSLLFAGHETTANMLTWAWYLLSRHPEIERRLWQEIDSVLHGEDPTIEHLSQLSYARMIIDETLRLYPVTFSLPRRALADDEICGYRIPANHVVWTNFYGIHYSPAYWEQPEVFDPTRFSLDHPADGVRTAYFPFGSGPHLCIGNIFALMEGQLLLAMIAQRYQLQLAPGPAIKPAPTLTIRPEHGLPMLLKARF